MKKKILVIDDSALMRRVLSDIIKSDQRLEVAGLANDGLEALDLVKNSPNKYDAILLDINMPNMNGIEFLEAVQNLKFKAEIIIVSTIAKQGAKQTIRGLELGALDFVKKPESFSDVKGNKFRDKVVDMLIAATGLEQVNLPIINKTIIEKPFVLKSDQLRKDFGIPADNKKIVAIACSTGGPKALNQIITKLPANLDASVLIVQHMPEGFTKSLADRLNENSKIDVKEAKHGDALKTGVVYIAKGGHHMRVQKQGFLHFLTVKKEQAVRGLMPCADLLFESLIYSNYDEITCIVLTGMGSDGTIGIKKLSEEKRTKVIAQDKESSIVYGMPRTVYESGLVDKVATLDEISDIIINNMGVYKKWK